MSDDDKPVVLRMTPAQADKYLGSIREVLPEVFETLSKAGAQCVVVITMSHSDALATPACNIRIMVDEDHQDYFTLNMVKAMCLMALLDKPTEQH